MYSSKHEVPWYTYDANLIFFTLLAGASPEPRKTAGKNSEFSLRSHSVRILVLIMLMCSSLGSIFWRRNLLAVISLLYQRIVPV